MSALDHMHQQVFKYIHLQQNWPSPEPEPAYPSTPLIRLSDTQIQNSLQLKYVSPSKSSAFSLNRACG
jgi:hypothetical protein